MKLQPSYIRRTLLELGDRDWPDEWSPGNTAADDDFLGWCHRYRVEPTASETTIARFEERYGIGLPADYRQFLMEVGNGAAGPGYGIWPLGEGEDGPLPDEMLDRLGTDFAHTSQWNDEALLQPERGYPDEAYYDYSVIAGAVEIATDGCALYHLLVISGPAKGQIWYDKRTEGEGLAPMRGADGEIMQFSEWYMSWLEDTKRMFGRS